jgi:hypothetical protein
LQPRFVGVALARSSRLPPAISTTTHLFPAMWEDWGKARWIRRLGGLFGETMGPEGSRGSISVIACDKREAFAQGSVSDEAIHSFIAWRHGLLRFARNDVDGQRITIPPRDAPEL